MEELNKLRKIIILGVICIIISIGSFVVGAIMLFKHFEGVYVILFGAFMLIVSAGMLYGKEERFTSLYKVFLVDKELKKHFTNVTYSMRRGFDDTRVREAALLEMSDAYKSEDYLKAEYEETPFEQSDFFIQKEHEVHGKAGRAYMDATLYKGTLLIFEIPDKNLESVNVYSKDFSRRTKSIERLNKCEMENVEFNSRFDVYAANEQAAFYLLTPQFMEKLMPLASHFQAFAMRVVKNRVYAVYNKQSHDIFDPDSKIRKMSYSKEIEKIQKDIEDIKLIIKTISEG